MTPPRSFFPINGQPAQRRTEYAPPPQAGPQHMAPMNALIGDQQYDPQYGGYVEEEQPQQQIWSAPAPEYVEQPQADVEVSEEDFDASLGAIQERIKVANYLQLLLEAPLFGEDESNEAAFVLARVRTLLRQEAEVVLGIRSSRQAPEGTFSPDEVQALKTLAARVLQPKAPAPAVQPVQQQPPKPIPVPQKSVQPKVQPIVTPATQAQQAAKPKASIPKAQPKPTPRQIPQQPQRQPQAQQQPPQQQRRPVPVGPVPHERIPGIERTANNRLQRTLALPDQNIVIVQDLTPQTFPSNRLPMPSNGQMEMITQQQAMATVQAQGNKTSRIALLSGAQ